MKFYSKILLSAVTLVSLGVLGTSCSGVLDVEPKNQIDAAAALTDELGVTVMLNGALDGLSNRYLYGGEVMLYAELLGDDGEVRFAGTFGYLDEIWRKALVTSNGGATNIWISGYDAINRVNNVLSALDKVGASNKSLVEGTALFIRGAVYFEMVRYYGKTWGDGDNNANPAVPLILKATTSITESDKVARNSVAEVYNQALTDLQKAEELLPTTSNGVKPNKAVAAALLSRLYLMQGKYEEARDAAQRVLATNRYKLATTFPEVFAETSAGYSGEVVYRTAVSEQDGANSQNTYFAPASYAGRGDIRVLTKHRNLYETGDFRNTFYTGSGTTLRTAKYNEQYGDVIVVRIAEMYLTRAECNLRLKTTVGATPLEDVNKIRSRAGVKALTDETLTIDAVLKERRTELAFEGHFLHDLKRTKRNVSATFPYTSPKLVMPVPQREMDANPKLVQNPGY